MIDTVNSSLAAALNQVYQVAPKAKTASTQQAAGKTTETEDMLTLSGEAKKALELPWLFGVEPGKPITTKDMKAFANEQMDAFGQGFRALMRDNDIDTSQPITLGHEPGTGKLIVTNDHPDADEIEALLEKNPELCNQFTAATSTLALIRHGEEHSQFAEAYAKNPQAAVAQYSYLFDTQWNASVTFTGDDSEVAYNRVPRQ
jgi:hypothetical protein